MNKKSLCLLNGPSKIIDCLNALPSAVWSLPQRAHGLALLLSENTGQYYFVLSPSPLNAKHEVFTNGSEFIVAWPKASRKSQTSPFPTNCISPRAHFSDTYLLL